jgi:hypothetical protein
VGRKSRAKWGRRAERKALAEEVRLAAVCRKEDAARGAFEGRRRGCLFCRQRDGGFTSQEHIFPESLGNTEHLLPVGVVCDRCNHGVLSALDAALCDFLPISMMRTVAGIPSKAGKLPSFDFDNGSLRCVAPGELSLELDSARWHKDQPAPPGHIGFSFSAQRQDMTPRRLAKVHRALVKMLLEYVWQDLGEERALSSEFDRERSIVLDGGHHGYLVLFENNTPDEQIRFQYEPRRRVADDHPMVGILASFWGVPVFTDTLFAEPVKAPPPSFSLHTF